MRLIALLARLRAMGFQVAWVCHNLFPHESRSRIVDYAVRLALARLAHVVVVHSQVAKRQVRRSFLRVRGIVPIRIGHYVGVYPEGGSRDGARGALAIADHATVYLFFGLIRPYKGVELLIDAFKAIPDEDAVLLIAGRPQSRAYGAVLEARIAGDQRIRPHFRYVPDEDVGTYFRAADVTVLPFRRVLTSASVLLSLSFGVPVLIPPLPSITEYVDERVAYVMGRRESLACALVEARARLERGQLQQGAPVVDWARRFDWHRGVEPLVPRLARR